jgi:hemolysin D
MSGAVETSNLPVPVPQGVPRKTTPHVEFLPAALEILDTPASPAGRAVAATISVALVAALVWSCIGRLDIVATAPGNVIPAGKSKLVQPLETGIVRSILVQDGDHVAAGQTLFELDAVVAKAERDRLAVEWRKQKLDAAGLRTLRDDLKTGSGIASFAPPDDAQEINVEVERAQIAARRGEREAKLAGLRQQIAQKQAELETNKASIAKLTASIPLLAEKEDLRHRLLTNEFGNRLAWLDADQALIEAKNDLIVQQRHGPELQAAIAALQGQVDETQATYAHDVLSDLADAEQKAASLGEQYAQAAHKAELMVLRAPIDGTVQSLAVHTIGGVVTPAEAMLTVVPDDDDPKGGGVLLEVQVENKDIGFVRPGQDVAVKVQTFEFTRYGLLHGHVLDVSRDRVGDKAPTDPNKATSQSSSTPLTQTEKDAMAQGSGYVAHVALDATHIAVDGRDQRIEPGMAVTAEIKTGQRSVISYLLSPVMKYAHEGWRER